MQKLRILLPLPLCQLVLAIVLLGLGHQVRVPKRLDLAYTPTPTLVCMGINAPVLIARPLIALLTNATPTDHPPGSFFDFTLDEILFLVGVVIVWYVVARWLVARGSTENDMMHKITVGMRVRHLVAAAVGIILFLGGVEMLRSPGEWNNAVGQTAEGILFLVWACALLYANWLRQIPVKRFGLSAFVI